MAGRSAITATNGAAPHFFSSSQAPKGRQPMTERLYYSDPYCREFDATVSSVDRRGDRTVVTLDRTAFYPTSGGQPFDTGTLGGLRVDEVIDADDGSIEHVLNLEPSNPEPAHQEPWNQEPWNPGDAVHGVI